MPEGGIEEELLSQADLIRGYVKEHYVDVARRANQKTLTIVAGEVGRDMRLSNRMANICSALRSRKFLELAGVRLVDQEGPMAGASARFRYAIGANQPPSSKVPQSPARASPASVAPDRGQTVVIQCAASKRPNAGHLTTEDGKPVFFVANTAAAPRKPDVVYRRPDDVALSALSWREVLTKYNATHGSAQANPLGLLPAWRLYRDPTYEYLVDRLSEDNVFILSAGWGLVSAAFLTPNYDITFAGNAEDYKRRQSHERYADSCMLPKDTSLPITFLGGKDYVPLFCRLTEGTSAERLVYHVGEPPCAPNCRVVRFETNRRTNWHYECARRLL